MTAPERIWRDAPTTRRGYMHGLPSWPNESDASDRASEYILHARAALAASPLVQEIVAEAVQWQPIETAPKNCNVLVYDPLCGAAREAVLDECYGEWVDPIEHYDVYHPTHWMPLPAMPHGENK